MKNLLLLSALVAVLGPATLTLASPGPPSLTEQAALKLLLHTLEQDKVYAKRISLDCVTFDTEEKTNACFGVVLRENHAGKCGGDPNVNPVLDRYRVHRTSKKIEWYDAVHDTWQHYDPAKIAK